MNNEIPSAWVMTTLGDVCEFLTGYAFPKEMQGDSSQELPFYKVRDISVAWNLNSKVCVATGNSLSHELAKSIKAYPIPTGTIIFAKIGEALRLNRRAILPKPALIDNNVMGILGYVNAVDQNYLYWFTTVTRFDADARASVVPSIRKSDVADIAFPLPPFKEQTRIVEKLEELFSDLDAAVAELKAAQKKLAQYRQSLLKAAVEGALTAEWRTKNTPKETGAQLLERILKERRTRWEEKQLARFKEQGKTPPKGWQDKYPEPVQPDTTNLPELPEGWVWASGEQLCDFITKGTTPPKDLDLGVDKVIPFLRVTNLTDSGELDLSDKVFVSKAIHEGFLARSAVYPDDVLMNIVGPPLGQVSVVPNTFPEWNINQAIAIFRAVEGVLPGFVSRYLLSPLAQQWLKARSKTTAGQTNLTLEVCRNLPFPLPPTDEQRKLVSKLDAALESILNQSQSIEVAFKQAAAQRKNILKSAFSGQLVPQDPNDEPASLLLERIRAERQTVIKSSKKALTPRRKPSC